jgi:hypothetical protein
MRQIALALVVVAAAVPAASASVKPSPSRCAVSWNQWSAAGLRKEVAKAKVRAAFIEAHASVGTDTWSRTGGTNSTSAAGCFIQFVLPSNAGLLTVWGSWQAGIIHVWHGPIRVNRRIPVPNNARVHSNGTLGFTG